MSKEEATEKFYESHAGDGTTVHGQYMTGLPLILSFGACFACFFLMGLDQVIMITLLESIGSKFNAFDKIGWLMSGYMLTMAVFAQTWGRLSINFGRKYTLLLAIVIFEAGSLMCALANDMNTLIGGRVFAGVGGSGIQTLGFVIGTEMAPIHKRPLSLAILATGLSVSSLVGPIIGGVFVQKSTWRWCFYINLPLGGLAFAILAWFYRPEMPKFTWTQRFKMIDYPGIFLLTSGLVLFLLGLTFGGGELSWDSGAVISCIVIGVLLLAIFLIWNFKFSKYQIFPTSLVNEKGVIFSVLSLFFCYYSFLGSASYMGTYFQIIHNSSPIKLGLELFPFILPFVIGSIVSSILMKKTRQIKPIAIIGGIIGCVGYGLVTLLDIHSSSSQKVGYLILAGTSTGIVYQTGILAAQLSAPKEAGSTILTTSFFSFARAIGGTMGSTIAQIVFDGVLKSHLNQIEQHNSSAFQGLDLSTVSSLLNDPSAIALLPAEAQAIVKQAIMKAIRNVFYMSLASAVLSFVCTLFYSNKKIPLQVDVETKEENEQRETNAKTAIVKERQVSTCSSELQEV